jgi:hypothetical protein
MSQETIDSLVVTVDLDGRKFEAGHKSARKELEQTKHSVTSFLSSVKTEAAAAFAVLASGYGFKELVTSVTETSAALGLMANNLQVTTQELNAWGNVTQMFGGSASALQGTVSHLTEEFERLHLTGESSLIPFLTKLSDLDQSDAFVFLDGLKAKMDQLNDPKQANFIMKGLGIDQGTINAILNTTSDKFHSLIAEQQKKNLVDKEGAKKAQDLTESYYTFHQTLEGIYRDFVGEISPGMRDAFDKITGAAEYLGEHKAIVVGFFSALGLAATAAVAPMVLALAPVLALGAAIGLLYDDFSAWKQGGAHLIDWAAWELELNGAIARLEVLVSDVRDLTQSVKDSAIIGEITESWFKSSYSNAFELSLDGVITRIKILKELLFEAVSLPMAIWNKMNPDHQVSWGMHAEQNKKDAALSETRQEMERDEKIEKGFGASPIAKAMTKAEGDYDSVNLGKAGGYKSDKVDLSKKTVNEVMADQEDQKYNAAGRYQIIKGTLKEAKDALGLSGEEKFDQETQDKLGSYVLGAKRKKLDDYIKGISDDLNGAQKDFSLEMASVANPDTGESSYPSNNKASISPDQSADLINQQRAWYKAQHEPVKAVDTPAVVQVAGNEKTADKAAIVQVASNESEQLPKGDLPPEETLAQKWQRFKGDMAEAYGPEKIINKLPINSAYAGEQRYEQPAIPDLHMLQQSTHTTNNNTTSTNAPSTSSNEVHIGSITVQTKATDAPGIASDLSRVITNQSDFGMR